MKSLLYQDTNLPFTPPAECAAGRKETSVSFISNGKLITLTSKSKICASDPYIRLVKAFLYSLQTGEPYAGVPPNRAIKDLLVRENVTI
jgi:hypothetical protein